VTDFIAILHAGSLVSCHNFLSFPLCFSERFRSGISYFRFKIAVLLVEILYDDAMEAAKSLAALSASSGELNYETLFPQGKTDD
jgi:hypothetical protein